MTLRTGTPPTANTAARPRYVVVEGPIGVGKTTLARRLAATYDSELLLELAAENPFLPKFYEDPRRFALPTQLFFLFQRIEQLKHYRQTDLFTTVQVSDFLIEKDRIFAKVTLEPAELDLYTQVYDKLIPQLPVPDLVIYLQAPVPVLMRRVARRGIDYEQRIEPGYLDRLCAEYVDFFYYYDRSPLLIVNAEEINLADNEAHYQLLIAQIEAGITGKHYFNPGTD